MGSLSYLGSYSFLEAFPVIALAKAQISASVGAVLPDVSARLAGAIQLAANVAVRPPSLASSLTLAANILANLQVAIAPPSVNFAATAAASLIARLGAIKLALQTALVWGTFPGSVHVFVYNGAAGDMGSTISSAISGGMLGGVRTTATVLAPFVVVETSDSVSVASLQTVIKT